MELNRRNFVRGAAAMGAVGAMGAAGVAWADAAPAAADDVAWDAEYDVVVLGLGGAGANAAVAAYEEGAKVLVCEKAPEGQEPCNTKASGQFVMATDDAQGLCGTYLPAAAKFTNWDEEALMGYCEGCAENFEWMCGPMGGDPDIVCPTAVPESEARMADSWILTDNAWGLGREGYIYCWDEFPEIPESARRASASPPPVLASTPATTTSAWLP